MGRGTGWDGMLKAKWLFSIWRKTFVRPLLSPAFVRKKKRDFKLKFSIYVTACFVVCNNDDSDSGVTGEAI